ncbi:hypothetical protein [Arthrobacter sp. CJ23]|uniref:hypothetical protein n=1 Tax=Arthrobacter sp. CJ23 TaxID=2972479 RepID=UPI00215C835C|nr:hypothetical protein [Arthrobacter sp. CJ23]UVJ40559.1 hypothetical protein NVV90_05130 [Arthrobacter sp. CJ23]
MEKLIKSNQEQAVASWVNYLNQLRIDTLLSSFAIQDENLRNAITCVDEAIRKIDLEIVSTNRGGQKGMHGFIAEIAEVGVGNARERIFGKDAIYQWVNDNGPVDMVRGGIDIQQKFVAAGGRFSLGAVTEHLQKYPDYVKNGGRYQIPRDHFETIQRLRSMSPEEAGRLLSRSGEGATFKDWQRVDNFFSEGSLGIESIEPSKLEYHEVQKGLYESTLEAQKDSLRSTDQSLRDKAYQGSRPKLQEGAKATAVAAVIEGGTTFVLTVTAKRREGKRFKEFSEDDWSEILGQTGIGVTRGGVRGLSIYSLTNFTATSAAVASSIVTATFGIAEQAHKFRNGEIGEFEFIENAELVCLEAAVSALSSFIGQALIPVPVLGAVIGNTVGAVMYRAVSSSLSKKEAELISRYLADQHELDRELAAKYNDLIEKLDESMSSYLTVLERAFSPDLQVALLGSVELARELGVPTEEILDTKDKALSYFLD